MKQQKSSKSNPNLAVAHGSMDFFHYLQERPSERFSRFEAYIYMLDKACVRYRPQNIEPKWVPAIGDGQFFITKTQLAADWHWHRATVRDYLAKLTEYGHLVVEDHLKGMLCTLPHLIISVNPNVAVVYNFDSMAKYTMYSWADGKLKPHQVAKITGQIERSARVMLYGDILSTYSEKQLEDTQRMMLHYAIEAIIANHLGEIKAAKEIGSSTSIIDKRLQEFFIEHLGGSWQALLTLLEDKTEVTLNALVETVQLGKSSRDTVFGLLRQETSELPDVELNSLPKAESSDDSSDEFHPDASSSVNTSAASNGSESVSNNSNL